MHICNGRSFSQALDVDRREHVGSACVNETFVEWYTKTDVVDVRSGGRAVELRIVNRGDGGSIPPTAVSKLRQFRSPHIACVFRKRH